MNPFVMLLGLTAVALALLLFNLSLLAVLLLGIGAFLVLYTDRAQRTQNKVPELATEQTEQLIQFNRAVVELIQQCQANLRSIDVTQLEAVNMLSESFQRLKAMTDLQTKQVQQVLADTQQRQHTAALQQSFQQGSTEVINHLVTSVLAECNPAEPLKSQLASAEQALTTIEEIAQQLDITLHALQESVFVLAPHNQSMLEDIQHGLRLSHQNLQHLQLFHQLVMQYSQLLSAPVDHITLNTYQQRAHVAMSSLLQDVADSTVVNGNLDHIKEELQTALHQSIRGLQFGDINSQQLNFILQDLHLIQALLTDFIDHPTELSLKLQAALTQVDEHRQQRNNPVSSSSMASGEVELF